MKTPHALASAFLTYIRHHNGMATLLAPDGWFSLAVKSSGGQGNPKGTKLALEKAAGRAIHAQLDGWIGRKAGAAETPVSYDDAFVRLLRSICETARTFSPGTAFSFGRAQKIANIYIKYAFASSLGGLETGGGITGSRTHLHIPVDRQTLRFLYAFPDCRHLTKEAGGKFTSWKWDLREERYLEIQQAVRKMASSGGYADAMHLEMDRIWTQPSTRV